MFSTSPTLQISFKDPNVSRGFVELNAKKYLALLCVIKQQMGGGFILLFFSRYVILIPIIKIIAVSVVLLNLLGNSVYCEVLYKTVCLFP